MSSAVLSCEGAPPPPDPASPTPPPAPPAPPVLDAEEAAPDPGMDFARASLPAWLMAFLAGRMSGIPWNWGGSEESRSGCEWSGW